MGTQWDAAMSSVNSRELKRNGFNADMDLSSTGFVGQVNAWQQYQQWAAWAAWQQENPDKVKKRSPSESEYSEYSDSESRSPSGSSRKRQKVKSESGLVLKSRQEVLKASKKKDDSRRSNCVV